MYKSVKNKIEMLIVLICEQTLSNSYFKNNNKSIDFQRSHMWPLVRYAWLQYLFTTVSAKRMTYVSANILTNQLYNAACMKMQPRNI